MTYLEELRNRYKEARKRMEKHAIREKAPAISLPPPMPKPEPEPEPVKIPPKAGLVSEKDEKEIVCNALKITDIEKLGNHSQLYKMADEITNSPRLPPLPGLVLNEPGAVRWMRIMHAVAKSHGITPSEIMSASRERHIVIARFEIFYRLRIDLAMSYTKIGTLFGKDHTTIMHGVNKVRKKLLDEKRKRDNDSDPRTVYHLDRRGTYTP